MKCDFCGTKTSMIEELDYCSLCIDCFVELDSDENVEKIFDEIKNESQTENT